MKTPPTSSGDKHQWALAEMTAVEKTQIIELDRGLFMFVPI